MLQAVGQCEVCKIHVSGGFFESHAHLPA
jgi:hypothetical protein